MESRLLQAARVGPRSRRVVSASYFHMKNGYRAPEAYNVFLTRFLRATEKGLPREWKVRLYVDDSVPEWRKLVSRFNRVEVYSFNCPAFRHKDGHPGHEGTFGTLARFLPLFEPEGTHDTVWVTDIDTPDVVFEDPFWTTVHPGIRVHSYVFYSRAWIPKSHKFNIVNNYFVSTVAFPRELIDRFLDRLTRNGTPSVMKLHNTAYKAQSNLSSAFMYGMDEYFTNNDLYLWIQKQKHVPLLVTEEANLSLAFRQREWKERATSQAIVKAEETNYYHPSAKNVAAILDLVESKALNDPAYSAIRPGLQHIVRLRHAWNPFLSRSGANSLASGREPPSE
jgi:hypothetical protein